MKKNLVSVIVSVYNEPIDILKKSIFSIINQTYKNIEIILINDNPSRKELNNFLDKLKNDYSNIIYIKNKKNLGLVKSLNIGLKHANGEFIARMDADDISIKDRIEKQIDYLKRNSYDFIGCNIIEIDEFDNEIREKKVPSHNKEILKYIKYGSCLFHPTWFLKKEIYDCLNGYREVQSCEDYDFIIRAIHKNYKFGNVPQALLKYRIRENGISVSTESTQRLLRYFLSKNINNKDINNINFINSYKESKLFKKNEIIINNYIQVKNKVKRCTNIYKKFLYSFKLIFNKYFYISIYEHYMQKQREKKSY